MSHRHQHVGFRFSRSGARKSVSGRCVFAAINQTHFIQFGDPYSVNRSNVFGDDAS